VLNLKPRFRQIASGGQISRICFAIFRKTQRVISHICICFPSRDRCYDFLNIFAEKFSKKLAFLIQNKTKLCKILFITMIFEKNAIFCRKLAKITENCDHNIEPRVTWWGPNRFFVTRNK
jgi:hypothetical protein